MLLGVACTLAWWFYWYPPKWLQRWRKSRNTQTDRDTLLADFKRLQDAYRQYAEDSQNTSAAVRIGLLTDKHADFFESVEDHHDARARAVTFCVEALEAYPFPKAMEVIRDRLQKPFRVRLAGRLEIGSGNQPISGIPELERCREELAEYIRAATKNRMVDGEHMAASFRFLPHLLNLCEILDTQEIPHPKVELGIVVLNGDEWDRYLAKLWAVRHDIERARRVYQGDSRA